MAKQPQESAEPKEHRGRLQAQGPDVEESVPWGRDSPPTKSEMLEMLAHLWGRLTHRQQEIREVCYAQAAQYISNAPAQGYEAEWKKTFQNRKERRGVRIDIEIWAGRACVDDPQQ